MMNTPISVKIECAKGEIMNALDRIEKQQNLPPCILECVLSSVIAEVRSGAKLELINGTNQMLREKDEELEKAKSEAKRVLKAEPELNEKQEQIEE